MNYHSLILKRLLSFTLFSFGTFMLLHSETLSGQINVPRTEYLQDRIEYEEPEFSCRKLNYAEEGAWISELENITVSDTMEEGWGVSKKLNVYYRYNQPVEGYTVTCRFLPFSTDSETGYLIARFQKGNECFIYRHEKRCNFHVDHIRKWQDGDVYAFDYIAPDFPDLWKTTHPHSPLGYYTPFQFVDVDFDGEKELVVNDYDKGSGGNSYMAYKLREGKVVSMPDILPLSKLNNEMEFDAENRSIILTLDDGAYYHARFCFKKQDKPGKYLESLPAFHEDITTNMVDEYQKTENIFSLDSIIEIVNDTVYSYRCSGHKLELER